MSNEYRDGADALGLVWQRCCELRPELVSLARRYGMGEDAEDVVHDAFVRVSGFRPLDPLRVEAFLVTVIRRLSVDRVRADAAARCLCGDRRLRPVDEDDVANPVVDRVYAGWLLGQHEQLDGASRQTLLLLAEGRSREEVAGLLGTNREDLDRTVRRARYQVRRLRALARQA